MACRRCAAGTRAGLAPVKGVGRRPGLVPFLGALGRLRASVMAEAGGQQGWFRPFYVHALQTTVPSHG